MQVLEAPKWKVHLSAVACGTENKLAVNVGVWTALTRMERVMPWVSIQVSGTSPLPTAGAVDPLARVILLP